MISKSIRILLLALIFFSTLSLSMGLQQMIITLSSSGTISHANSVHRGYLQRRYICGNYNSTHYYAQNNGSGYYELISTDASQTISYALSKLTPGRTWQETVLLKGNFLVGTTITLSVGNVLLDCRQASLTLTANTILLDVHPSKSASLRNTILGGHWIGYAAVGTFNMAIRFVNAMNCTVDGINAEGFSSNGAVILAGWGSSHITIQNCLVHDNAGPVNCVQFENSGYNNVINCSLYNSAQGIFVGNDVPRNKIFGCEFYGWYRSFGHAIYLDGGASSEGNNIVSGCSFHDPLGNAALHIKCHNNTISNNTFANFPQTAVPLSIYSEYSPSYANDNDIFNNTFTDCYYGIWLGHDPANYPTLRNRIHDNTFTNVNNCILLNPWSGAINTVEDTWIYYNAFSSCVKIFPLSGASPALVKNTVVAYNDFGGTITDLAVLQQYVNSMVYGNIGMEDFNVPSPLPIPPK